MLENLESSPVSCKYFTYLNIEYGQKIAPVGILTLCSVVSAKILAEDFPIGFNLCKVAPSGHFKSRTSSEAMNVTSEDNYTALGSDFTFHAIHREYRGDVRNKCLFINDGTLLLESKTRKAKERLINGIAELLADGCYTYGDFREGFQIRDPCTCVFNLTPDSFRMYRSTLFASTFIYRFLVVHYKIPLSEMRDYIEERERRKRRERRENTHIHPHPLSLSNSMLSICRIRYMRTRYVPCNDPEDMSRHAGAFLCLACSVYLKDY